MHGIFGTPWGAPSYRATPVFPTPVGALCPACQNPIEQGDRGHVFTHLDGPDAGMPTYWHRPCVMVALLGEALALVVMDLERHDTPAPAPAPAEPRPLTDAERQHYRDEAARVRASGEALAALYERLADDLPPAPAQGEPWEKVREDLGLDTNGLEEYVRILDAQAAARHFLLEHGYALTLPSRPAPAPDRAPLTAVPRLLLRVNALIARRRGDTARADTLDDIAAHGPHTDGRHDTLMSDPALFSVAAAAASARYDRLPHLAEALDDLRRRTTPAPHDNEKAPPPLPGPDPDDHPAVLAFAAAHLAYTRARDTAPTPA